MRNVDVQTAYTGNGDVKQAPRPRVNILAPVFGVAAMSTLLETSSPLEPRVTYNQHSGRKIRSRERTA